VSRGQSDESLRPCSWFSGPDNNNNNNVRVWTKSIESEREGFLGSSSGTKVKISWNSYRVHCCGAISEPRGMRHSDSALRYSDQYRFLNNTERVNMAQGIPLFRECIFLDVAIKAWPLTRVMLQHETHSCSLHALTFVCEHCHGLEVASGL
jgi:hypothetical protein